MKLCSRCGYSCGDDISHYDGLSFCSNNCLALYILRRQNDNNVNPVHYKKHPSGTECIEIVEHFNFNLGNAIKYIWRCGLKLNNKVEDLRKAAWYINREISRIENEQAGLDPESN